VALHQLTSFTLGVPNPEETAAYYREFGLTDSGDGWFASRDGGRQLRLVTAPTRRLLELRIGADDADDLARAASRLIRLGIDATTDPAAGTLTACDQTTRVRVVLQVTPRLKQPVTGPTPYNGPGRTERAGTRAPGILRTGRVSPRKLDHVVIGTTDFDATAAFFRDGLGLQASDYIKDAGTFSEYYSDMDCVPEDRVWTPETFGGALGLFNWGPPPPPSFLHPDDLTALMAGSHSGRRPV